MALMLTLVVTTVAAVALTAATAVTGRYSQLEEMDRSYYNVTSAAKLFWDKMGAGKRGDGVQVHVTRSCDAVEDVATGALTPILETWTLQIDDVLTLDAGTDSDKLDGSNASIFQIATANLLFGQISLANSDTPHDLESPITLDQVAESIDDDLSEADPKYADATYKSFKAMSTKDDSKIKSTEVTLKCKEDGSFSFVFTEEAPAQGNDASFRCTLEANVGVTDSGPLASETGNKTYHVEWDTVVTWDAESMSTGGGTYA